MTIIFENDSEVIVHALEKIICHARKHQYVFVAQSIWWIASTIGLTEGLIKYIDNQRQHSEDCPVPSREIEQLSLASDVLPETKGRDHLEVGSDLVHLHPDRKLQINNMQEDLKDDTDTRIEQHFDTVLEKA